VIQQGAGERFCHNCGAPNSTDYSFCLRCGRRIDFLHPLPSRSVPGGYPVRFDVDYPEKLSRLSTLARLILAIPQLLVVYALGMVTGIVTFIAWFAILFTGRYPKGLFDMVVSFNRWTANVYAYLALLRDEYPPFSPDPGRYPVTYEVDYPEKLSRWLIFVKWFLAILHQIVLQFLGFFAFLFGVFAWFAILITGRYPRPVFNYIAGVMRWYFRVAAYTALLRDEFPPFSRRADAKPGSGRAVAVSAILAVPVVAAIWTLYIASFLAIGALAASTEEVDVRYADVLAGDSTAPVDVEGNLVTLLIAQDPASEPGLRQPRAGRRLVRFEVQVLNQDALFTLVGDQNFRLKDTSGDEHDPLYIEKVPSTGSDSVARGESVVAGVVFEVANDVEPSELTYAPGFAAFFFIGERVRFNFR
jgi:hypothetical protein